MRKPQKRLATKGLEGIMRIYGNGRSEEVESFADALEKIINDTPQYFTTDPGTPEREEEILKMYPGLFDGKDA
jgi:hypothetical protein